MRDSPSKDTITNRDLKYEKSNMKKAPFSMTYKSKMKISMTMNEKRRACKKQLAVYLQNTMLWILERKSLSTDSGIQIKLALEISSKRNKRKKKERFSMEKVLTRDLCQRKRSAVNRLL